MDCVERSIRQLLPNNLGLATDVIEKVRKRRRKALQEAAVAEITSVNEGYFILPTEQTENDRLPADGPVQLNLDLDDML